MKKYLIALAAIATIAGGIFVGPLAADAIAVSWDRPIAGRINPLYILDTVYANVFNATSTTAASNFTLASTSQLSVFKNAYFGGTATSSFSSTGALSLGSPLGVGSGGTGLTSISNGELFYGSSTPNTLAQPSGSGANILFWDNTNSRLGIGTAAPSTLLHVNGTSLLAGTVEMSTTITSGNLGINGIAGTAHITTAPYLIEGSAGVGYRVILGGGTTATVQTAGDNYAAVLIPKTILAEATSGNHPILSALAIRPLNVTSGVATVSTTSTLFIEDAATTTTASGGNFSLYVLHGNSWLNGNVTTNGTLVLPLLKAAAGTFLAVDASGNVIATSTPAVGGSGTVTSVQLSTPNSTLTLGGTNPVTTSGTIQADINLAHANIFSALQSFLNSSTTLASNTGTNWFGKTATTTINADGNGSIVVPSAGSITSAVLGTAAGTFLAADPNGKIIATTSPSGTNYFTNSGIYTYLSTGLHLGIGSTTPFAGLSLDNIFSSVFGVSSSTSATATLGTVNTYTNYTSTTTSTYTTAGSYSFVVPTGVTKVLFKAWGAGGGGGKGDGNSGAAGGDGGYGTGYVTVSGGQTLTIVVGTGGLNTAASFQGGNGGGYTGILISGTPIAIIGSGGGGSGAINGAGASGGSSNGATGGNGGAGDCVAATGATQSAAGNGGTGCLASGGNGASQSGGDSGASTHGNAGGFGAGGLGAASGGGGGAGWFGGGGGARDSGVVSTGGGGAGGSTYFGTSPMPTATSTTARNTSDPAYNGTAGIGGAASTGTANPGADGMVDLEYSSSSSSSSSLFFGIGTTTPAAAISVTSGLGNILQMISGSAIINTFPFGIGNYIFQEIDQFGHLFTGGPSPTCVSGCTTASGDDRTLYTVTNGSVTSMTLNYANAWSKTPVCAATDDANIAATSSSTPTNVKISFASTITVGHQVQATCQASRNAPF